MAPNGPPTVAELLSDATVVQAMEQAWIDSQAIQPIDTKKAVGFIWTQQQDR